MLLTEFFSKSINATSKVDKENKHQELDKDDLFWYIVDHDKIHKEYFFPIAKKVKSLKECGPSMVFELYMPMVIKGCKEYYQDKKLQGRMEKLFNKDLTEELCERLHNHFYDDIKKDTYKLG